MKIFAALFGFLAAGFWYLDQQKSVEEWSISLKEMNQSLPAPIWMICLGGSLLFLAVSIMPKKQRNQSAEEVSPPPKAPPKKSAPQTQTSSVAVREDWRQNIQKSAEGVSFPRGGSIVLDVQKDTPLSLRLPHKTHQAYKDSIDIFCQWLVTQPTPKRISVRFDAGVTEQEQNLVRSVFRKHYHISDHIIQQTAHSIDVLFHHPAREWGTMFNLFKDFSE